jgi:hypothetical protein
VRDGGGPSRLHDGRRLWDCLRQLWPWLDYGCITFGPVRRWRRRWRGCDDGTIVFLYSGFLPCPAPVPVPIIGDGGPDPDPKSYRTYFLVVTSDCYSVPNNGGTVTRYVSYQLDYLEEGMPAPMFTNTGTIWEHLSGDLPPAGANSPSSGPRGTYEDVLGIFFSGIAHQSLTQTFSATLDSKVSVGLAIAAFGGTVANPVAGNSIEKYPGYISINGNTGGQVQNGRLVPGTYKPCN